MATVLNRTIRTRIPQRDGRFYAEIEFTVQDHPRPIHVRATMLDAGTDVDAWADAYEAKLDDHLKEEEWREAVNEALVDGLNPLRAEKVYAYQTKQDIANRMLDRFDPRAEAVRAELTRLDNAINRIKTFLGIA